MSLLNFQTVSAPNLFSNRSTIYSYNSVVTQCLLALNSNVVSSAGIQYYEHCIKLG